MSVKEVKTSMPSSVRHGGVQGTVVPVGTNAEREPSPAQGTVRAGSSTKELELYIGNSWITYSPKIEIEPIAVSPFTAKSPSIYPINTTSGPLTVTLPSNAKIGDTVTLIDVKGKWNLHNVSVKSTTHKIDGLNATTVLSVNNSIITFFFTGANGWTSDIVPSGLPANEVVDADWPLTVRVNQEYYISLNSNNDNVVTLPVAETGDKIRIVSVNDKLFKDIPITVNTTGNALVNNVVSLALDLDTSEIVFEYRATKGWVITSTGQRFHVLHNHEITQGSLNGIITEGSHKINGSIGQFSMAPLCLNSEPLLIGSLNVSWNSGTCTQELTVVTNTTKRSTRKFLRSGIVSGLNVNFSNSWVELSGIPDNSKRVITSPANLYRDLNYGQYYITNPVSGTPDHSNGDVYFVEVTSSGLARPDSQVNYTTRYIKAWNVNKRQWWEAYSTSLTTATLWRKLNGNHTVKVVDGDAINHTPLAPVTNIWVDSEGNQSINLSCPAHIDNLQSTKVGDIVVIHNLRENVSETVITSNIDFIDPEGQNIGSGPHVMTGKGALKLLVEVKDSTTIYFKILFGVKS